MHHAATQEQRAERRAAPSRPAMLSGAEPGHAQSCGLCMPGEEFALLGERGLQGLRMPSCAEGLT